MIKSITGRWARAAVAAAGACALVVTAVTVAPAATSTTLPTYYNVQTSGVLVQPGQSAQQIAYCKKANDYATGGGFTTGGTVSPVDVETSEPFDNNNAPAKWNVVVYNSGTRSFVLHAWVICVHY